MVDGQHEVALRGTRIWLDVAALSASTDEQLLDRFSLGGGQPAEVAFAVLVSRHGPMVLRVCRAALRNEHDAEDAFQASFLVLARRGGTLWVRESLGPWLHRVASRVAARVRARAAQRVIHERRVARSKNESRESREPEDIGQVLHAEIERLSARYRSPVILCDLEGRSHEEAAAEIGCPVGTIKSRLARAREKLRQRLERRGLVPAVGLGSLLAEQSAIAVPTKLALTTIGAASLFAVATRPTAETVPGSVLKLAEGVMKSMTLHNLAIRIAALLAGLFVATGVLVLAADRPATRPEPSASIDAVAAATAAPAPPEKPIPKELQPFQGVWIIGLCDTVNKTLYASNEELQKKWRWTIKGDEIIWAFKGEEWKLSLKVDQTKKPNEIDLTYQSGLFKGETCQGIYEWGGVDGKTLQIALQDPGAKVARPKSIFPWSSDSQTAIILLRQTVAVDPKKELAALQGTWILQLTQSDPKGCRGRSVPHRERADRARVRPRGYLPAAVNTEDVSPVATADFDGDGQLDLAVIGRDGASWKISAFLGNGDGTFRPASRRPLPGPGEPISSPMTSTGMDGTTW